MSQVFPVGQLRTKQKPRKIIVIASMRICRLLHEEWLAEMVWLFRKGIEGRQNPHQDLIIVHPVLWFSSWVK